MSGHDDPYYSLFLLIRWLIMLSSHQPAPSYLLERAMQMKNISTDSIFFRLQQVEEPGELPLNDQGDYHLLLYKTVLWKIGTLDGSLLQIAIRQYKQNEQQAQYVWARIERSASYLYRSLLSPTLLISEQILKGYQLNDTLETRLYRLRRAACSRKQDCSQALVVADSNRQLALKMKDTLFYFSTSQLYPQIINGMQDRDRYAQSYLQLMKELMDLPKYQPLNYYALESLLSASLQGKDSRQVVIYLQQLSSQHRGRNEAPRYLLLCGRTHATLNQISSAQCYYRQATISSSSFTVMETNTRLFNLTSGKKYPEQAFYTKQKESTIRDDVLDNINMGIREREFNQLKLQNGLHQLYLQQQQGELWMLGIATALLSIGFIAFFFYRREKKRRLLRENQLLYKETEVSGLQKEEIRLRNKEAELREALFWRMPFLHKLPSLHASNDQDGPDISHRIAVTDAEWAEVTSVANDVSGSFVARLRQAHPQLGGKEIGFCCLVKINVNIQGLSDIYCMGEAAITKRRYRIKTDKLGITDKSISLDSFLKVFQLSPRGS